MTDIPEDVMEAARAAFRDDALRPHMTGGDEGPILCIARAIMADRERYKGWVEVPPGKGVMFVDLDQAGDFSSTSPRTRDGYFPW